MLQKAKCRLSYWALFIGASHGAPFCSDMFPTKTETAWTAREVHTTLTLIRSTISASSTISRVPNRTHDEALSPYASVIGNNAFSETPLPPPRKKSRGDLTFFVAATDPTAPSACGMTNNGETEFVVALPQSIMDLSDCGKDVAIEYKGTSRVGRVVDKCIGCDDNSIDLSIALFHQFADLESGRLFGATWSIIH